jgi:hypothetical protein
MANLIPSSTSQADSAPIVVAAGTPTTLALFSAVSQGLPNDAWAEIKKQSSATTTEVVGRLTYQQKALVLDGPGTFLVTKGPSSVAFGVDQD